MSIWDKVGDALEHLHDKLVVLQFKLWYECEPKIRRPDCTGCVGFVDEESKVIWLQNCLFHSGEFR